MIKYIIINKLESSADILLSDGAYEFLCFMQPFNEKLLKERDFEVVAFSVENIVRDDNQECFVAKKKDYYGYRIKGKLISKEYEIVEIGEFHIKIELIPEDINENEYIQFSCLRLDIW